MTEQKKVMRVGVYPDGEPFGYFEPAKVTPVEAQAVPGQPVAWMVSGNKEAIRPFCTQESAALWIEDQRRFGSPYSFDIKPLFTRPTPAAADLHQQIINLPCRSPQTHSGYMSAYNAGHRDARHAAAQLVAASPAAAAPQPIPTFDQWKEALRGTGYLTWQQADECATLVLNMLGATCK